MLFHILFLPIISHIHTTPTSTRSKSTPTQIRNKQPTPTQITTPAAIVNLPTPTKIDTTTTHNSFCQQQQLFNIAVLLLSPTPLHNHTPTARVFLIWAFTQSTFQSAKYRYRLFVPHRQLWNFAYRLLGLFHDFRFSWSISNRRFGLKYLLITCSVHGHNRQHSNSTFQHWYDCFFQISYSLTNRYFMKDISKLEYLS